MYPYLMLTERFPVKLRGGDCDCSPESLVSLARDTGVIARVTVRVHRAEYPYRDGEETIYPEGEFTTTLAGPDILALVGDGEILAVHEMHHYRMGRPFEQAMRVLLDDRAEAKARGDEDAQSFSKLCANSIAGKLAQRQGRWKRAREWDERGKWGEYRTIVDGSTHVERMRYLAGAAWRWEQDELPHGPHTYAFAYLTAYGRQMMRRIRNLCPPRSVVSQDTDGLWVLPPALTALTAAGMLARSGPGTLRVTDSARTGRFYGPRHYRVDDRWTLAGFSGAVVNEQKHTATSTARTTIPGSRCRGAPTEVVTVTREEQIPRETGKAYPGSDGWLLPPLLFRPIAPDESR